MPPKVTKKMLLEENRSLKNILQQIHNLTAPFVNCNNELPQMNAVENVPEQMTMEINTSIQRNATVNREIIVPITKNAPKRQRRSNPKSNDSGDLLKYLQLKKVASSIKKEKSMSNGTSKLKIEKATKMEENREAKLKVVLERLSPLEIEKWLPASQKPPQFQQKRNEEQEQKSARKHLARKAAPINLKEFTPKELKIFIN